ncbi:WXG100 family type VII secretion target [Actinomycetospora termitidis]|uniref:WXG100 family type VII secretion target n=1 Tax=Actinomycetospora termitidis TaxID=3053470 RepID=A0ABT7M6Q5_9PSEU|nr:WXG100 family type VII secretion target [Actinomycetospora sp. Odt1-22]MDL5155477.1 WXG100 family type VII secretion target [Actinomycetospora sp. Odt1-22]
MTRRDGGRRGSLSAVPPPRRLAELGADTSDALLAAGDAGIAQVAAALPARVALVGTAGLPAPPVDVEGLRARHTAQRGIRFAAIAAGADDLRRAADRVRARHRALADEAGVLWEQWSGPSADEVADRVVALGRAAQEIVTMLAETAETVEAAGLAVADDVTDRAAAARALAAFDPGPAPGPGAMPVAARAWAGALDTRLQRYLDVADRTDVSIADTWRDLAERLAVLRRLSGTDAEPAADDPSGLPPDLLALPEILAALGGLGLGDPDEDDEDDDAPEDRAHPGELDR